eukprot:327912-Alexandrium_andersonii.AAC.1
MAVQGDVAEASPPSCSGMVSVRLVGDFEDRFYAFGGVSVAPEFRVPIGGWINWARHLVDHATPLHRLVY